MAPSQQDKQALRKNMMATEPMNKIIPKMAIPSIIAFLITSIYNLADTYFVSHLGTNAVAAVSVNASLDQIVMMAGSMLAVGANSYIARLLGAKQEKKASQVLSVAFFIAFVFGAFVMVGGTVFMEPLVRMLGATDTCVKYAMEYATYVLLVAPFMATSFVMNQCLRAEGSAMLSMIGMGFGGILNCILDPIFIFGLDLGVAGASIATAISKFVSFLILIFPYMTGRSILRIKLSLFKVTKDIMYQIVSVGSSSLFRNGCSIAAAIVLNHIAGGISDGVLAAVGISTKVMMFPFGVVLGFGTGFQPVAGFNWGAKRFDRVRESFRYCTKVSIIGSVIMGALLVIFANPLIRLFSEADPVVQEFGALCIRLQSIVLPAHAWVALVNMYCSGLGNASGAVILATSRQGTCFLPIVYPLAAIFGAYGVAAVQAVADMLTVALAVPILIRLRRKIRLAEEEYLGSKAKVDVNENTIPGTDQGAVPEKKEAN